MSAEGNKQDKDLNDLLDNALQDFDKTTDNNKSNTDSAKGNANDEEDSPDAVFMKQAQMLADRMSVLFSGPDAPTPSNSDAPPLTDDSEKLMAGFKRMAEAAALTLQGENSASDEDVAKYSDTIGQALKSLQEGTDNLNAPVLDTDWDRMFSTPNVDASGSSDSNMFLPFMEGMMQSLLSAEILLPSIKELISKYPKYFEENGDKISAEDKTRYEKQFELYKVIGGHLEAENANDTAAQKREKFHVVLEDMRKLQEYGQPPEEILAETTGDLPLLDPSMLTGEGAAGANPQCPMM